MADMTLEEALAASTVNSSTDSDILTISNDLRTITIPESIKNLGVESDEDVNRIHFKMPKMYKDVDLTDFDIRINYINGNDGDKYIVEDKTISEDYITFSWLVGRNALKTKGSTRFIVCLKKTDSEGIVQKEFNTTLASINVLEGLETTEQIMQKYPDVIEQILKKIEGSTTITPDQISEAVEEYMTANQIQAGATEEQAKQIEKNMQDISKLSDEIANLKDNGTGSGTNTAQANSLWSIIQKSAFAEALTDEELNNFKTAWGITTETVPATGITLNKTTLSFTDSATQTLIATVEPSNSTDSVTWETSDAGIATVSSGVVSPVSNGSCTITAKAGSYSVSCEVTVNVSEEIVTLQSISATYTGGEVATGTALTDLTGITVTATYSDGSTKNVTGYTLSGEILECENTITVSYGGKTTTFTVTGIAESSGDAELPTDGLYGFFDLRNPQKIVAEWHTAVEPLQGSGVGKTYLTTTNNDSSFDEYGLVAGQLWLCDANVYGKEADSKDLGTEFSICVKHYGGIAKIGDHTNVSNVYDQYCGLRPKYNTSSGTGVVPQDTISGTHGATEYHNVNIVVNGEIFKFYLDGELIKTYKGSNYNDFTSWYSKNVITTWYNNGKVTAVAVYTKALNEVEVIELDEYFKTLEVA